MKCDERDMLIEVRISPGKGKLKSLMKAFGRGTRIRKIKSVPHLTLYGPFRIPDYNEKEVMRCIEKIGRKYDHLPFLIDGLDCKKHPDGRGDFVYFVINPSEKLRRFRKELIGELEMVAPSQKEWDKTDESFLYHITLATHLYGRWLDSARSYIHGEKSFINRIISSIFRTKFDDSHVRKPYLPLDGLRITLLNDHQKIRYEYDLARKKTLNRMEALSRYEYKKTLESYRIKNGIQICEPAFEKREATYLMGDLHLDHANIIRFCARPFADINDMNNVLVNNWNYTVKDSDTVYFVGDLVYGKSSRDPDYWINILNGNIEFIRGNHDARIKDAKDYTILEYKHQKFLVLHYPDRVPEDWDGWVIHGHKHNNNMRDYPFINGETKTINVGVELIGYKPINIDYLLSLDIDSIKRMDTINSKPIRAV
jgi:calcineurin-like phosphoesterase family protein/2'-5' RNA ligase